MKKERQKIFDQAGLEAFATHVKSLRKELGFTQQQLAFESGLSLTQIARIETAVANPTLSTIFTLARALDISLTTLFSFALPDKEN
jgi:transcriptional regulator with XRE-family HTH domain